MMNLRLGEKDLQIHFGYKAVAQSGILNDLAKLSNNDEHKIDNIMNILPKMILVGVQKYHKKDFGYDYRTKAGENVKLEILYDLLDEYFDEPNHDYMELFNQLQDELTEEGFLSKLLREENQEPELVVEKIQTTIPEEPRTEIRYAN